MAVKEILGRSFAIKDRFIPDYKKLEKVIFSFKEMGLKIALTQGTWDMFHPGHVLYLVRAKEDENADILIAVTDTDKLTQKRKGPSRPFDVLSERAIVALSQRSVDIVTVKYEKDHPHEVIKIVSPDFLIVSQRVEEIKQEDLDAFNKYCGKVISLESQASVSTTAKLSRVRKEGVCVLGAKITEAVNNLVNSYFDGLTEDQITEHLKGNPSENEDDEVNSVFRFINEWELRKNGGKSNV